MSNLAILLDAPMQSWGTDSLFNDRETNSYPSKSGVGGMLRAAMGLPKKTPEEAAFMNAFVNVGFTAVVIPRGKVGRMIDFHTIGGGYDPKTEAGAWSIPRRGAKLGKDTVITTRHYLTDARFIVILGGDINFLQRAADALLNPVWGVWLGRKACLPSMPLLTVMADTREDAFAALAQKSRIKVFAFNDHRRMEDAEDGNLRFDDNAVPGKRVFSSRRAREVVPRRGAMETSISVLL